MLRWLAMLVVGLVAVSCARAPQNQQETVSSVGDAGAASSGGTHAPVDLPLVIFLGDSLSAGFGVSEEEAFPALVEESLAASGSSVRVVNAGVSGDTTAGGLSRLDWLLSQEPDLVVVELGANDGLRGLSLENTADNLRRIILRCLQAKARVLLVGMKLPPSYGSDYARAFEGIYSTLAEELDVPLVPFLLDGVAADPKLNLVDGIHPNRQGHRLLAGNVLPYIEALLEESREVMGESPP